MRFIRRHGSGPARAAQGTRQASGQAQQARSVSYRFDGGLEAGAVFEGEVAVGAGDGLAADVGDEVSGERGPLALELVAGLGQRFEELVGDGQLFPALAAIGVLVAGSGAGEGEGV